jgi:hypothetical protein
MTSFLPIAASESHLNTVYLLQHVGIHHLPDIVTLLGGVESQKRTFDLRTFS